MILMHNTDVGSLNVVLKKFTAFLQSTLILVSNCTQNVFNLVTSFMKPSVAIKIFITLRHTFSVKPRENDETLFPFLKLLNECEQRAKCLKFV